MSRKRLILDCDGPAADFTGALLQSVESTLTVDDITDWYVFERLTISQEAVARKVCEDPDWWRNLPVIPGSQDAVAQLSQSYEILWATSPWWSCVGWDHARRGWLKEHFGAHSDEVAIISNKSFLGGDVLIDDKPEHIEKWTARNPYSMGILYGLPHNQSIMPSHRIEGWPQIVSRLTDPAAFRVPPPQQQKGGWLK